MREDILAAKADKLARLTESFGTAYPEKSDRTHTTAEAVADFTALSESGEEIIIVGRVRSVRTMGKIAFAHLEDGSGRIQIFLSEADLGSEAFRLFSDTIEMGDFVNVQGTMFLTKKEEKTVAVKSWRILGKSMRPIPTDHFGIEDKEELL
ncbi:MAG: lysine--tRNA ligase, partial [Candidatus Moranbacteria bacterium]|nr:lysine--tRNA ligase [Candidatus Moranbacteria bacterium]